MLASARNPFSSSAIVHPRTRFRGLDLCKFRDLSDAWNFLHGIYPSLGTFPIKPPESISTIYCLHLIPYLAYFPFAVGVWFYIHFRRMRLKYFFEPSS